MLKTKTTDEIGASFKSFKVMVENEKRGLRYRIQDLGLTMDQFRAILQESGLALELSAPYTKHQNAELVKENSNRYRMQLLACYMLQISNTFSGPKPQSQQSIYLIGPLPLHLTIKHVMTMSASYRRGGHVNDVKKMKQMRRASLGCHRFIPSVSLLSPKIL